MYVCVYIYIYVYSVVILPQALSWVFIPFHYLLCHGVRLHSMSWSTHLCTNSFLAHVSCRLPASTRACFPLSSPWRKACCNA